MGRRKQQTLFSKFQRLEVQGPGVGSVDFPRGLPPCHIDGRLHSVACVGLDPNLLLVLDGHQSYWTKVHPTGFMLT